MALCLIFTKQFWKILTNKNVLFVDQLIIPGLLESGNIMISDDIEKAKDITLGDASSMTAPNIHLSLIVDFS